MLGLAARAGGMSLIRFDGHPPSVLVVVSAVNYTTLNLSPSNSAELAAVCLKPDLAALGGRAYFASGGPAADLINFRPASPTGLAQSCLPRASREAYTVGTSVGTFNRCTPPSRIRWD